MKDRSLWLDEPAPAYPPLDSDTEADVCIVGGGITGLSAACHLRAAAPALDVVVLERDEVGSGASGRSSGALTYIPERRWGDKLARDGIAETRRAAAFQRAGVDTVLRLVREGDIDCDRASPGYLLLGRERHLPYLRRELGAMKDLGQEGRFVDRAGLAALLVQDYYAGAVEAPAHWVHPGRYVRGLARLAAGRGARLHEHATVDAFDSGRARLATGRAVRARTIVLATNGYTPRLGALRRRVFALHTAALTTEPLSPGVREAIGWPGGHVLFEAGRGGHTFVLTPDGRMLCRGTLHYRYADGVTAVDLDAVESRLTAAVRERFPRLGDVAVSHRWSGVLGMTRTFRPAIGRLPHHPDVIHAVAYSGHGIAYASLAGRLVGELVGGERSPELDYALEAAIPPPMPPEPLRWLTLRRMTRA